MNIENKTQKKQQQQRNKEKKTNNIQSKQEKNVFFQTEIENFKKNIFNLKLRTQANIENLKKDAKEKIKKIKQEKKQKIINNLIPIIDKFEKIITDIKNIKTKKNNIIEGLSLTLFTLKKTLKNFGLQSIPSKNEFFNPELHETTNKHKFDKNKKYKIKSTIKLGYIYEKKILRKSIVEIVKNENS